MLILVRSFQICNSWIVSTLASFGGLSATVPDLANRPRQLVFLTPIDSRLNDFLNEIHQIARFEPSIVECIDEDLDLHAKKKKLLRLADAQFLAGQTPDLPKLQLQLRELKVDHIELETGRPRTEAYIVYLFLMLRGFNGGCKDQHARLLLQEFITLRLWLEHLGLELPPASTLSDNPNAVSNQTRALIQQAQMRYILQQVKEQITNTGVIPSLTSADDGYSSQQGREEVLGLGVKVVSISGAKGKKLIEAQQWKSQHCWRKC